MFEKASGPPAPRRTDSPLEIALKKSVIWVACLLALNARLSCIVKKLHLWQIQNMSA